VILWGLRALRCWCPAPCAGGRDHEDARAFFGSAGLSLAVTSLIGIATLNPPRGKPARGYLLALFSAFTVLPLYLALPFHEAVGNTRYLNAYIEMVSSAHHHRGHAVSRSRAPVVSLHLWRALVGWMGGLLIWVAAIAILAPLNLGGFEVTPNEAGQGAAPTTGPITPGRRSTPAPAPRRGSWRRSMAGSRWRSGSMLIILGETPLVAICMPCRRMATSGITPVGGAGGTSGFAASDDLRLLFFGLSRRTFTRDTLTTRHGQRLIARPGIPDGAVVRWSGRAAAPVPAPLDRRLEVAQDREPRRRLRALWGGLFTVLSFLSTTGFESRALGGGAGLVGAVARRGCSDGAGLMGGGVATTAGG
jgi:trk system potassium uptake protein TrkH